jgi:sporulation protein YlmC with PRC-barrel domain
MGDKMGKMKDLVIDTSNWKVKGLVISEKKRRSLVNPHDLKIEWDNERIILSPEVKAIEDTQEKSSVHNLYLSDLVKKHVISSDEEKVGRIFDVEITTELKDWEVWKLLIKVGFKKRRLRMRPKKISKLGKDVSIRMTKKEVEDLSHPILG